MHVLHLEDDPLQRALVGRGLKNAKFLVDSCSSIAEAVDLLDRFQYCVAVVDLGLHEENGMEFVGELVKRKTRTKAIIHTANSTFESARHGIELGIFAYVEKARGLTHLVEQVKRAASAYLVESHSHAQRTAIIGQMANSLAHEINQPLCAISNFAGGMMLGLMNTTSSVDELIKMLGQIQEQAIRAGEIVGRLRCYGTQTMTPLVELDIDSVIIESLKLVEFEFREHRIKVELNLEGSSSSVRGDRIQLIQVLVNVLRNAAEAMISVDPMERKCFVTTKQTEAHIQIEVQDQGPRIDPGKLPSLLEPYFTSQEGGVGLGLSICNSIMEHHRGSIKLACCEPRGLSVSLCLPRCKRS